jgi:hypothetical protein
LDTRAPAMRLDSATKPKRSSRGAQLHSLLSKYCARERVVEGEGAGAKCGLDVLVVLGVASTYRCTSWWCCVKVTLDAEGTIH